MLANLKQGCEWGGERLRRLERVVMGLAPDVTEARRGRVEACRAALVDMAAELQQLQLAGSALGAQAIVVGGWLAGQGWGMLWVHKPSWQVGGWLGRLEGWGGGPWGYQGGQG